MSCTVTCYDDCRQLGTELHELQPSLPLFDGETGQAVSHATDSRVERLRDALMDDARERVDDLGEDLVVGILLHCRLALRQRDVLGCMMGI